MDEPFTVLVGTSEGWANLHLSGLSSLNRLRLSLELPPGWAPLVTSKGWPPQLCSQVPTSTLILCGGCTLCFQEPRSSILRDLTS